MNSTSSTKLPHSLRLAIFFLRVALGLDFFYLGWSGLFNASLVPELRQQSFAQLYRWVGTSTMAGTAAIHPFLAWSFLIIGICLMIGFVTILASIGGIALTVLGYLPIMNYATLSVTQFINDGIILVVCLLIIIFAKAGGYLGLDVFFHFGRKK